MRVIAMLLAALIVATGCTSSTYKIPGKELQRLATVAPEVRGEHVRVQQELDDKDVGEQQPVTSATQIVLFPDISIRGPDRRNYYRTKSTWGSGRGGSFSGGGGNFKISGGGGGGGKGGLAIIVVILVVAAIALIALAGVEASRFDGFARIHPMHPIYLVGHDGARAVMPLAWLDPPTASWARHAYVRRTEGPWQQLERAPLDRKGLNFSMYGGLGTYRSLDGGTAPGPASTIQLGFFPGHPIGLVGSLFLGWRNTTPDTLLITARYSLELQVFPVSRGFVQAGFYGGYGGAFLSEERLSGGNVVARESATSTLYTGGGILQLDVNTRVALTARFGLANTGDGPTADAIFGLSVY